MTTFRLIFNDDAKQHFEKLETSKGKRSAFKAVCKTLAFMEINLRYSSLNAHEFSSLKGSDGQKVFESYAQNNTSGAYRVFWYYGPQKSEITVVSIVSHP